MHITHISLTNFRNYDRLELDLTPGATLLHGHNAQGKTNILEAIYYLATSRSPHTEQDSQLIHWQAQNEEALITVGRINMQVADRHGEKSVEMRLIQERQNGRLRFRREAVVNRRKVRLMDLLGNLRVVLFLPEDVQLITGSPSKRRRFVNITLCQIDPLYCRTLSNYNKTLEQRNATLRQIAETGGSHDVLEIFTERIVEQGSYLVARRRKFFAEMALEAQRIHYEKLTDGRETIRLQYLPRLGGAPSRTSDGLTTETEWRQDMEQSTHELKQTLKAALLEAKSTDLARGSTTIGPHRDDWQFSVNGRHLAHFGSRGQQRSAMLALKLAEIRWMHEQTGESPILLLDEVVAELDQQRRAHLLNALGQVEQAILTATDPAMFTASFLQTAASYQVENGRLTATDP